MAPIPQGLFSLLSKAGLPEEGLDMAGRLRYQTKPELGPNTGRYYYDPVTNEQVIVTGAGAPSSTAHEYGHGLSHTLGKLPYEEGLRAERITVPAQYSRNRMPPLDNPENPVAQRQAAETTEAAMWASSHARPEIRQAMKEFTLATQEDPRLWKYLTQRAEHRVSYLENQKRGAQMRGDTRMVARLDYQIGVLKDRGYTHGTEEMFARAFNDVMFEVDPNTGLTTISDGKTSVRGIDAMRNLIGQLKVDDKGNFYGTAAATLGLSQLPMEDATAAEQEMVRKMSASAKGQVAKDSVQKSGMEQPYEVAPEGYPAWATDPKQRERIDQIRRDKGLSSEQRDEIESDIWAGLREGFPRGASAVLRAPLALGDMVYELGDAALANVYGGTPEERSFTNFELPMFTAAEPYADAVTGVNRGFEPITPEGQVGLATGEAMMELGTLNAPLFLGVEKLPALGRQVLRPPAKVKARVNPTFDPSRRDLLKSTAIAGGALATGIGVSKLAKHADEMVHGTKGGRATAKAVTAPKWNTATQAIYDVDRSVARGGMDAVNRGLPPGFDAGSLDFGVMDARPRHLDWLHAPKTPPKGLPGRVEIHRFNYLYDIEKLPGGKKFANQLRQLHEQQARLIKQHGSDWHKTPDGKKHLDKLDELEGKVSGGLLNKVKEAEIARTRPHTRRLIKRRQELERRAQQMENDAYEEARVYHQQERQWEDPSYESYDYIDQQAVDTKWELLNENPEWKIVSDEMMQTPSQDSLIKYDPNTIAYREKRMQAMAAKHGDELWEAERERLVSDIRLKEGFYQSHVDKMAKSKANARDRAAEEARRDNYTKLIREAERDLARHMGLNPEATKTTSQDILNQIK